jgi:hypothetical protein
MGRMTQRQITHPPRTLPPCTCHRDPKHYVDQRGAFVGGGDFLECSPCDRRTSRCASLELATAEWCRLTGRPAPADGKTARVLRQVRG